MNSQNGMECWKNLASTDSSE
jgi:hypothetical protein